MKLDKLTDKLARWTLLLHEYDFEVVHYVGNTNLDANGLSHNPSPSYEDLTGAKCEPKFMPTLVVNTCKTLQVLFC